MKKRISESTIYIEKDFNVDTVYIRSKPRYYSTDEETGERTLITKLEFDKLDNNKIVSYNEIEYTYREYIEKLEADNKQLVLELTSSNMEMLSTIDVLSQENSVQQAILMMEIANMINEMGVTK